MADQKDLWERIAASFDATRPRAWPEVEAFLDALPSGSRVLDLMAGNGRHTRAALDRGHRAVWLDWSRPAARIARARRAVPDTLVADAARIPLAGATFDAVLLVAGLHGIVRQQDRLASLRESRRVLRPGAPMLLTVWRRDAPRFARMGPPGEETDVQVPWRAHGHDGLRHVHLYTRDALRRDVEKAGLIVESLQAAALGGRGTDNWLLTARRPAHPL